MEEKHKTLGNSVVPMKYNIEFVPNLKSFKFGGYEEIEVELRKPTNTVRLNSAELVIKEAVIESGGREEKARVRLNEADEQAVLKISRKMRGKARIKIKFSGVHNDKLYGFYRSRYMEGKKERYLLTTMFEPVDARRCFPCFDEPEFKAVFGVSVVVDKSLECVSNMPIKEVKNLNDGNKKVVFEQTVPMSTYLLYLGVGNFARTRGKLGKTKVSVLTTAGKEKLAALPLDYAKKFVNHYNDYFSIEYPLPKLDLIAIPDFAMGAMENWGAIAFREVDLLGDKNSSLRAKQGIAEVIAHEIAHQWFGDLVTMKWWDDLWLNESFATFMSYKTLDALFPEWEIGMQLLSDTPHSIGSALSADQLKATHPISTRVNDPKEIAAIFDSISYDKGSAILRMLEDYVGKETFRQGLHVYLKKHSYSNATKQDLWSAIDSVAKKHGRGASVGRVASYWIDTAGYPVIHAEKSKNGIKLSQRRFIMSSDEEPVGSWPIPLSYVTSDGRKRDLLFSSSSMELPTSLSKDEFIKLNYRQKGLYRVWYDKELLEPLGKAIKEGRLSNAEAWGVENDLFTFARSAKIKADRFLSFVSRYCFECGYPLNSTLLSHLSWFYAMLYGTRLEDRTRSLLTDYCHLLLEDLGFERRSNERSVDTVLRGAVVSNLGVVEDRETVEIARELFDGFIRNKKEIDANMKNAVYGTVAWNGGAEVFETMKKRYIMERVPEDKLRFLRALGLFKDKKLLERAFAFALSKNVRYQDTDLIPAVASSNPLARETLLRWTFNNWKTFMKRYHPGTNTLRAFVMNLSAQRGTRARDEIASFFKRKEIAREDMMPELNRTLERIDTNIRFMKANGVSLSWAKG